VACITVYGDQFGDPHYVLILDYSAFVLSPNDAVRGLRKTIPFRVPAAMTERERELAHEAWLSRAAAVHSV
jgi:hypothetical protein